jgi:hypothetical protein
LFYAVTGDVKEAWQLATKGRYLIAAEYALLGMLVSLKLLSNATKYLWITRGRIVDADGKLRDCLCGKGRVIRLKLLPPAGYPQCTVCKARYKPHKRLGLIPGFFIIPKPLSKEDEEYVRRSSHTLIPWVLASFPIVVVFGPCAIVLHFGVPCIAVATLAILILGKIIEVMQDSLSASDYEPEKGDAS